MLLEKEQYKQWWGPCGSSAGSAAWYSCQCLLASSLRVNSWQHFTQQTAVCSGSIPCAGRAACISVTVHVLPRLMPFSLITCWASSGKVFNISETMDFACLTVIIHCSVLRVFAGKLSSTPGNMSSVWQMELTRVRASV